MFQRQIQGRLEIYKSPLLLNQRGLVHGFSSRAGGFSSGVYSSLNLGLTSGDVLMDVRQNRMLFATTLGIGPERGGVRAAGTQHSYCSSWKSPGGTGIFGRSTGIAGY